MKCPRCGGDEFNVQVLAWAIYRAGVFQGLAQSTQLIGFEPEECQPRPIPTAKAICTGCGAERLGFWFTPEGNRADARELP